MNLRAVIAAGNNSYPFRRFDIEQRNLSHDRVVGFVGITGPGQSAAGSRPNGPGHRHTASGWWVLLGRSR